MKRENMKKDNMKRKNMQIARGRAGKAMARIRNLLPPLSRTLLERRIPQVLERYVKGSVLEVGPKRHPLQSYARVKMNNYASLDIDAKVFPTYVADIHNTKIDVRFDTVVALEVLEHLERPWDAVEEIHRLLRGGGVAILSTRFIHPYHGEPHDYYRFTEYALRDLFSGFSRVHIIVQGSWLCVLWDTLSATLLTCWLRAFNPLIAFFCGSGSRRTRHPLGFIIIAKR